MCFRVIRIELKRGLVLFNRFVQLAVFFQSRPIIEMRFCTVRNIRGYKCHSLHFGNRQMGLAKPERAEWKHEHAHPLQAVPCPAGQESAERYVSCAASKPERL